MSITKTVDIPASHQLTIDVPYEIPTGRAILTFTAAEIEPEYGTAPACKAEASEARDIEVINRNAERLNKEAEDVLAYQSLDTVEEDFDRLFSGKQLAPHELASMGGTVVPFNLDDIVRSQRTSKES